MAKYIRTGPPGAGMIFKLSKNLIQNRRESENLLNKIVKLEKDVETLELENQELKKRLKLYEAKKK